MMSVPPPAPNGTIIVIGRVGSASAAVGADDGPVARSPARAAARNVRVPFIRTSLRADDQSAQRASLRCGARRRSAGSDRSCEIHVIDAQQPPRLMLDRARIAEVPAAAIIAQHDLAPPGPAAVLAHPRAQAERRQAIAVDAGDTAVAISTMSPGAPQSLTRERKAPGPAAVLAREDLGPQYAASVALAAHRRDDAPVRAARCGGLEVPVRAEPQADSRVADGRAALDLRRHHRHESPVRAPSCSHRRPAGSSSRRRRSSRGRGWRRRRRAPSADRGR